MSGNRDFRALVEQLDEGIVVLTAGRFAYVNGAFARMLRTSVEELTGQAMDRHLAEVSCARFAGWIDSRARSPIEVQLSVRDGARHCQLVPIRLLAFAGQDADAFLVRDLTDHRRNQARLLMNDRMITLGALAAGLAHEVNNPLSYVLGNLTFLEEEVASLTDLIPAGPREDMNESVKEARQGAERVRAIIQRLREVSTADRVRKRPVDVRECLEAAITMAWMDIRHRAKLKRELRDVAPVHTNQATLSQVLLSVLLNAAHVLPEGRVTEHAIVVRTRTEGGEVVIEIEDDGPGLGASVAARLFETMPGDPLPGVGSPVGLSIAQTILAEMSGTLEVESQPGSGTRFIIRLPAYHDPEVRAVDCAGPGAPSRRRVLVVDDEPLITSSIQRALRRHDVTCVNSGREAIRVLGEGYNFDVIFCDLMMPEVTGMDVHAWVKEHRPGEEGRLVFMTGGLFTERAQAFLESIENPHVEKPFDLNVIRRYVPGDLELT